MKRYVRYAAAVVFALLALGFVALWVRSYYWFDTVAWRATNNRAIVAGSASGSASVITLSPSPYSRKDRFWRNHQVLPKSLRAGLAETITAFSLGRETGIEMTSVSVVMPHWFLAASSLGLAALFAFKRTWRYSLRAILVATTLLAGLLGLAVWAV
jgi:hypothetical protein